MQFKNILALSMVAIAATAAPADDPTVDLEARQTPCTADNAIYCCDTFVPISIFFIRGVGQGRCARRKSAENSIRISFVGFDLTKSRHQWLLWQRRKTKNPCLLPKRHSGKTILEFVRSYNWV